VLRGIFGPKRDEVTGGWRKLHNEKLHYLYSSPSIIQMIMSRKMRWAGHVTRIREKRDACRILVGQPERKRPLGRSRLWWVNNIIPCRTVSKQRPRDNQIYRNRCWVTVVNKHMSPATNQHATIEELLETVFLRWSVPGGITGPLCS
jgi:hypothetical protein